MPKISFVKNDTVLEAPEGANLMDFLVKSGLPVASSCGGEGVCTLCLIRIVEGRENLSRPEELEIDMREIHEFSKDERMSCQTLIHGDITIDTDYW